MSEIRMLLDEIRDLKRRLQALETRGEHPGFAASDVARLSVDNTFAGVQTIPNTGLHLLDTNASYDLIIAPGSNLTADRTLTVTTGDANRTLTLTGDATVNQDVSTAGSPSFGGVVNVNATGSYTVAGLKLLGAIETMRTATGAVGDWVFGNGGALALDNDFIFYDGFSGRLPLMIQQSTGNIGAGLTNPYNKFHASVNINETAAMSLTSTAIMKLSNPNNTAGNLALLKFSGPDNDTSVLLGSRLVNAGNGNSAFVIGVRNGSGVLAEQFTLVDGNVGIKATGYPRLKVESPSGGNPGLYLINGADSANQQRSLINHAGGNVNFYLLNDAEAVAYTPLQLLASGNVTMAGNVLIGTTTDSGYKLQVYDSTGGGTSKASIAIENGSSGGRRFRWWVSDTSNGEGGGKLILRDDTGGTHPMVVDSSGNVLIGTTTDSGGKLQIDQSSTTAAIPALRLNQADISEGFVDFIGTSAASAAGPISSWTVATIAGYVRCEINGAAFWLPYYNAPTA